MLEVPNGDLPRVFEGVVVEALLVRMRDELPGFIVHSPARVHGHTKDRVVRCLDSIGHPELERTPKRVALFDVVGVPRLDPLIGRRPGNITDKMKRVLCWIEPLKLQWGVVVVGVDVVVADGVERFDHLDDENVPGQRSTVIIRTTDPCIRTLGIDGVNNGSTDGNPTTLRDGDEPMVFRHLHRWTQDITVCSVW